MFEGLETGGYAEFQDRVQGADKSTLHWIAAQLMNPTIDTPQGERMLQTMSKTNIFSGGQLVATPQSDARRVGAIFAARAHASHHRDF